MKHFWAYTALRLGLFVACTLVAAGVWALVTDHVDWLAALVIGAIASAVLSWRMLSRQREMFAADIDSRARRMSSRFEEMKAREDHDEV